MQTKLNLRALLLASLLITGAAHGQNTVVTYQGRVQSGGSDFTGAGQFKFALVTVTNTASTATAAANPPSGGFITIIIPTFGGSGYVTPPAVTITGGGGSGATATATLTGGAVTSITVNNVGSGYTSTPTVTIAPPPEALAYTTYWSNDGTSSTGSQPATAVSLPVNAGLFTARLGDSAMANMTAFPANLFHQANLHLRLWFDDGVNGFTVLHPTHPLSAAPYAFTAGTASNLLGTVTAASLSGTYSQSVTFNNAANNFTGNGAGLTSLNASRLTTGTVPDARLATNLARTNQVWLRTGNTGTTPGGDFLGTTDNQPLEVKVNDARALRLEPTANVDTVNVIGGSARNVVGTGAVGATIGGGGAGNYGGAAYTNRVDADFGTVAGGRRNIIQTDADNATIGGGWLNTIESNALTATISGGYNHTIQTDADNATIGGGWQNTIQSNALTATVGGGYLNRIHSGAEEASIGGGHINSIMSSANYATIGGGYLNTIQTNGRFATIPGGAFNSATNSAFAAGRRAKANHLGAFVWADAQDVDFASASVNEFAVRASGGVRYVTAGTGMTVDGSVGIGETAPEGQLHITGSQTTPQIKIETTANNSFVKLRLESFGKPYWDFAVGGSANVMNWFYSATSQNLMSLATNGTLTTVGPVNPPSDRNVKQDFVSVNALAVLEKVAALPIQSWAYKNSPETRHIGPVAQDFHAAFQFNGDDDKHISTVDADGVALAAIQGLNQKLEQKLEQKETEITELKARMEKLEQLMNQNNRGAQ